MTLTGENRSPASEQPLPPALQSWFDGRGWGLHDHQRDMLQVDQAGHSALLIAPTGGGKTLAGFLPSLCALINRPQPDDAPTLHSLYISPLKALAVDVHRNLLAPIEEAGLEIRCETRTGDTPQAKRQRQREKPPQILMTTPESLALMLSWPDAPRLFGNLERIIIDELHALAGTRRGDLLSLDLARLSVLSPPARRIGLSATVADEAALLRWLARSPRQGHDDVRLVRGKDAARAEITILKTEAEIPWGGHMALYALPDIYHRLRDARTAILFVNTRAQAELIFQELWRINDDNLPIALHHGSLSVEQRRKVEVAMARGVLRAVVATASLDLGIDWAAVDLVIQIGAPKGASRLLQRIGRSNHRLDMASKALLVPANRFEMLECQAAIDAVDARDLDGEPERPGGLDILAQHLLGMGCCRPFEPDAQFDETRRAAPYRDLSREDFDAVLDFTATGGYALAAYDRYRRLFAGSAGYEVTSPQIAHLYRMNVGTIIEEPLIRVRLRGGRALGEVEEYFIQGLRPGDSFVFAGEVLCFEGMKENTAMVTRSPGKDPKVPAWAGGRLPFTRNLARRVREMLEDPERLDSFPPSVRDWLRLQRWHSLLPPADGLLVETFPRRKKEFLIAYCFEGRNAHQTLGMLLTRRMERAGLEPLGFVASDYAIAVWSLKPVPDRDSLAGLFDEDMLGDDLEEWMAESSMLRRIFRNVALTAGLIERRHPGREKSGRQVTISSDLVYDVLRDHQPDHILLRATRTEAAAGLTDIHRLGQMLARIQGKIRLRRLDRVSPLAVPVLLEIGKETVSSAAAFETLLEEEADSLIAEALRQSPQGTLDLDG